LLDGKNIYDYGLEEYRNYFAMLNQEPSLFAGTIEENIKYNLNVDKEILNKVSLKACAYTCMDGEPIPSGIERFHERRVGPKGSNISGGEKQRVACARALLREPTIFLMDEGTSALDIVTERNVLMGLEEQL
jgi:ATP-binding cassette subfamily B (MDR/TAP) protein 1